MKLPPKTTIKVCAEFVEYAAAQDYVRYRPNAGALLFEWTLVRKGLADPPCGKKVTDTWRHDLIWGSKRVDFKEIDKYYFNIQNGKTAQYRESIALGELTHFFFYHSNRPKNRSLVVGDVVVMQPIGLLDAECVLKLSNKHSNFRDTEAYLESEKIYEAINQSIN